MRMDKKPASTQAIMQGSIGKITHDVANSISRISNTVQLLERDLKKHQEQSLELIGKVITTLKNECSRMQIQLEELRQLSADPDEPVRGSKKKVPR
jgi:nitrogen-specific signal transduction histidine kinase